ncbi:hypothetical protein SmJEL517_g03791 [Synchytrium microbalum]|uniref:TAFII28-like protein domain-containing protein n=1 Tax=Synchytrium microbalum TaxID=1806994 RepID=A0A507C734_9FUNG|nr:uncharacterized protein SmJEL517_g03791 [Synchytrium microbalum]TPX33295.1 hypothetical protein SmJEL517_g03791 [Synchytrium microbalum]
MSQQAPSSREGTPIKKPKGKRKADSNEPSIQQKPPKKPRAKPKPKPPASNPIDSRDPSPAPLLDSNDLDDLDLTDADDVVVNNNRGGQVTSGDEGMSTEAEGGADDKDAGADDWDDEDGDDDAFGIMLRDPDPLAMSAIMARLSPDQMSRYEHFRRSKLPKNHVNKVIQNVLSQKPPPSASFVVQSAGKLFVGDMTERALTVQAEMGDIGALQPKHLREAYRRYRKGPTSYASTSTSLFKKDKNHL